MILLLISPDFLASDYCYKIEMQRALERQQAGQARVIPLILRPCDWQTAPFGHLQVLPRNGQPITTWSNQDEAFLEISRSLRALLAQPLPGGKRGGSATQNRANMLVKLRRMYDEVLDDSLQKLAWIDLPLASVPGAVHTTANLLLRRANLPAQPLAPGTTVQQVYHRANQELLILGDPGTGKSTLLYQLGRDLLAQAQQPTQPLPVVFPLSSWAQKRLPLQEWMVEQLYSPLYEVPRRQSRQWVQNQQILPLLDGLDEVEEAARPACIAIINAFRSAFPLCPLVVCSRSQEYRAASPDERLHLYSAVEVQPLTARQQEEALQQAGTAAEELRAELASNAELRELARTPLWLNVLLLTTREAPLLTLPQERLALQQEMLRRYIQRMCERKGDAARYPLKQTIRWLGFLASQMRQRNLTVFAIEQVQPDWLVRWPRLCYHWSVAVSSGLAVGLAIGLAFGLFGLVRGLLLGLVMGPFVGLFVGLIFGLRTDVILIKRVIWSWNGVRYGLIFGSIPGLASGLTRGPVFGLTVGLVFVLFIVLLYGLLVGLMSNPPSEIDASSPGGGIYRPLKNGLFVGLVSGLLIGLVVEPDVGLIAGSVSGLVSGLVIGLGSVFQHLTVRFWLARADCLPWQVIAFLNDSCERALLKRVGGTYRFIHRLILDYFADLSPENDHF